MTAMECPHCQSYSTFTVVYRESGQVGDLSSSYVHHGAIKCHNPDCRRVLGAEIKNSDTSDFHDWWPKHVGGKKFPDVPEMVGSTANEAHECFSIGAYRGSVALARAVVESIAKSHEITAGNLASKIKVMEEQGIISESMREAADEIRFAGNEVAHGDLAAEPIDRDDAGEVLDLMDAILARVYQEPNKVKRVRERREARKPQGLET